ncbi:MAG: hypothetical protein ACO2ZA_06785 [Litorivicinaceae bacterium]
MNWIKHHTQTVAALACIGATLLFCAYAIIDYESDQCHYRDIRGFNQALGTKGWCRIL